MTFVVLREKVRAVRRVRDIDGMFGRTSRKDIQTSKLCCPALNPQTGKVYTRDECGEGRSARGYLYTQASSQPREALVWVASASPSGRAEQCRRGMWRKIEGVECGVVRYRVVIGWRGADSGKARTCFPRAPEHQTSITYPESFFVYTSIPFT
jgi:hypothetical protein